MSMWGLTAKMAASNCNIVDYGAVGNGIYNCDAAFTAAVAAAKALGNASNATGGVVYIPPGAYSIRNPIVLPRTGVTPTTVVSLLGANQRACQLIGHSSFPANRAMIEWEATTARAWGQRIENLTMSLPAVAGTMGLWWKVNSGLTTYAGRDAERLQLDLIDVNIECSNDYHASLIRIEGGAWYSTFRNVCGDPNQGVSKTYDTLLLDVDYDAGGEPGVTTDVPGISYSQLTDLHCGWRRGGFGRVFKGRLVRCIYSNSFANGARTGSVSDDFINCAGNSFTELGHEGQGEDAQVRLTNGRCNHFAHLNLGTPNAVGADPHVGNGLELVNSTDNIFEGRLASAGQSAFSTQSVKLITLDANSARNKFSHWLVKCGANGISDEITNSGSGNVIAGVNMTTGAEF
jgi:hypothetical protein